MTTNKVDHVTTQTKVYDPKAMGETSRLFPETGAVIIDVYRKDGDMITLDVDDDGNFILFRFKEGNSEVLFKSKDHTFKY